MPGQFTLPKLIAHRGANRLAPENTLAAIKKAKALGATWVEFDVQLTRDGVAVLLHDNTVTRTTNGEGFIYQQDYAKVCKLDAGSWFSPEFAGEPIPTLASILDYLISENLHANIEIKDAPDDAQNNKTAKVVCELLKTLPKHNCHFLLSSFSFEALQTIHQCLPDAAIGMLIDIQDWQNDWQNRYSEIKALFQTLDCTSLNVNQNILTAEHVKALQTISPQILTYTVNDLQRAQTLLSWGITGIFSDTLMQL